MFLLAGNPTPLLTLFGLVAGAGIWLFLLHQNRCGTRQIILSVILVGLVARVAMAIFTPTFYAPDEQSHFKYVQYLYEHQTLPVQTSQTYTETNDWEYYQPPVYYLSCVPIYWAAMSVTDGNIDVAVRAIRFFSIALWMVNVAFAIKILANLQYKGTFVEAFAISTLALLPTYVALSSSINNDNLLIPLGGPIFLLLSSKPTPARIVLLGALLSLALMTKLTGVVFIAAFLAWLAIQTTREGLQPLRALCYLLIVMGMVVTIFTPLALHNLSVYGDLTGESIANVLVPWSSLAAGLQFIFDQLSSTFWSTYGIRNNIFFLPSIGVFITCLAIAGAIHWVIRSRSILRNQLLTDRGLFLLSVSTTVVVNLILVLRFGLLYGQAQGRLLFPSLIPISLFLALGIRQLVILKVSRAPQVHAAGFFIVYLLSFVCYSIGISLQF
jgi:hypothetical protein